MKQSRWLYSLVLAVLVAGCTPSVSPHQANAIFAASTPLLDHAAGDIAASDWPPAVVALKPERVYRRAEGIYICTSQFFVEEHGVFVLDPTAPFTPESGADPSYDPVISGIFIYRIAG
jgi:hypothetical protein